MRYSSPMKSKVDVYVPRFNMDFGDQEDREIHQKLRDAYFDSIVANKKKKKLTKAKDEV